MRAPQQPSLHSVKQVREGNGEEEGRGGGRREGNGEEGEEGGSQCRAKALSNHIYGCIYCCSDVKSSTGSVVKSMCLMFDKTQVQILTAS